MEGVEPGVAAKVVLTTDQAAIGCFYDFSSV